MGETTAYVMVGVPGSGKSTYAREHFHGVEIIEVDSCRDQMFGGMDLGEGSTGKFSGQSARKNQVVHGIAIGRCIQVLLSGKSVVHDGTNTNPEMRKMVTEALKPHADRVVCVWVRTSREKCLKRNALRRGDRCVPNDVIKKKFMEIQKSPPTKKNLNIDELVIVEN